MGASDTELQALRHKLLDLTLRNPLLNFRASPRRSLRIVDELPAELYDLLVRQEKTMLFRAAANAPPTAEPPADDAPAQLWQLEPDAGPADDRYVDKYLQTELASAALQQTLFLIDKQARAVLEEQGYTVLYLALGFLEWLEPPPAAERHRAPLILVPVDLERRRVGGPYGLRWTGEDLLTNLSLQTKVREQGVTLPDFVLPEDKAGIAAYAQAVSGAVAAQLGWRVVPDVALGFFSFTKFVMYQDLDPAHWPASQQPADQPLLHTLFAGAAAAPPPAAAAVPASDRPSRDFLHVVDADPSQVAVLEAVKAGQSLLVEGPPGTGKSQTILNLIAELLYRGRSVLFVSEKMAALEVVKNRLDHLGLGAYCLELHSRKANKREVLRQLEASVNPPAPRRPNLGDDFARLDQWQAGLNAYAHDLHTPVGARGVTPYELVNELERAGQHFASTGREPAALAFERPETVTAAAWQDAVAAVGTLTTLYGQVRPIAAHPWRGTDPAEILPDDLEALHGLLADAARQTPALEAAGRDLARALAAKAEPLSVALVETLVSAANLLSNHPPVDPAQLRHPDWARPAGKPAELLAVVEQFQQQRAAGLAKFAPAAVASDARGLAQEHAALSACWYRVVRPRWYRCQDAVRRLYHGAPPEAPATIAADLAELAAWKERQEALAAQQAAGTALFGPLWRGGDSDLAELRRGADWIAQVRQLYQDGLLTDASLELFTHGAGAALITVTGERVKCRAASDALTATYGKFKLKVRAEEQAAFGGPFGQAPLPRLGELFARWADALPALTRWSQFRERLRRCRLTAAAPLATAIAAGDPAPEDVLPALRWRFATALLRVALQERAALRDFVGEVHEDLVRRFRALDERLIRLNRARLLAELYQRRPIVRAGSDGAAGSILVGELNRQRGHLPIRRLLAAAGRLVQRLRPCFMMSPLSIAQFLSPGSLEFDVVVFDEASQVRPEDALGAVLRSRQLVVMGDSKQLPPTSFFDQLVAPDESETPAAVTVAAGAGERESLLHLCQGRLAEAQLKWHYRSRHESLIAVSNQESYANSLLVFPSAFARHERLGLFFHHQPDTVYDRSRSAHNREEARRVAAAVAEHLRQYPDKSIGVGTLNVRQQQAIIEELELLRRAQPDLEARFQPAAVEPVFVKNLETIQGDERDTIIISIGLGFDAEDRLLLNFGPVNQDGGERRLNVLISRARERCEVFANFRAADLPFAVNDPSVARGLRYLKAFLHYAETRDLGGGAPSPATAADSAGLEDALAAALGRQGYLLQRQVGGARCRVDLALTDPARPGRYTLGIVTDGPRYGAATIARDRDRLRAAVLERLGWQLHQVWTMDWYRDRARTEARLLAAAAAATAQPATAAAAPAAGATPTPPDLDYLPGTPEFDAEAGLTATYLPCTSLRVLVSTDIAETAAETLAEAVVTVVAGEGPIQDEQVISRICQLWGGKRVTEHTQAVLTGAILHAVTAGQIARRGAFLWEKGVTAVKPRHRQSAQTGDIQFIAPEELTAALTVILKVQHETPRDELLGEACRLLGFQRPQPATLAAMGAALDQALQAGQLRLFTGGRLGLA